MINHRPSSSVTIEEMAQALTELRQRFKQDVASDKMTRSDLNRLSTEDWWPLSFLSPYKMDVDIAYALMLQCLKWRTSFDVHHISLLELKPLLDRRVAYIHGKDLNERNILWLNMSQHRNGDRGLDKLLVYWLERHTIERKGAPITVVFDMSGAGLQSMDLDFLKFFLRAFKYYYPSCLQSVLVFDNPTMLNASWKLVRSWMEPDLQRVLQHVTRASIPNFIPYHFLPLHMGGEDEFVFTMDELARCIPSQSSIDTDNEHQNIATPDLDNFTHRNGIKFAEDLQTPRAVPVNALHGSRSSSVSRRNGGVPSFLKPLAEARVKAPLKDYLSTNFIMICPREELTLNRVDGESDSVDVVVLKNTGSKNIVYKIKITSPEKFRVRPSTGSVAPGATEFIRVYLQNEYKQTVNREKFMLMALESDAKNSEEFSKEWDSADESRKVAHKLRCRLADNNDPGLPPVPPQLNPARPTLMTQHQDSMQDQIRDLARQQRTLLICVVILIILQLISLGCQSSYHLSLITAYKQNSLASTDDYNQPENTPMDMDSEL